MKQFQAKLNMFRRQIDKRLDELLPPARAGIVNEAMRYSVENGGKRVRPVLSLAFCEFCQADYEQALNSACAVEMIHAYSLIHDDLPCMDDDDMRRGKAACHIKYGQATALLAGDALLTLAFEVIAKANLSPKTLIDSVALLSKAAGWAGMLGGQAMDLANEGKRVGLDTLIETDEKKTGALIVAACRLGCLAAQASEADIKLAGDFAQNIGLAFQIIDDILDVTQSTQTLGKTAGSDAENEKSTYVTVAGLDRAQEKAHELLQKAEAVLLSSDRDAEFLLWYARQLSGRKS
ncbi:MAG: polyprenyl synthetase family protein [Clostridiales bacterium]|nr:polyprenyl synthetase family protein [Clostridiales bacterium]